MVLDAGSSLVGEASPALAGSGKHSVELMNRLGYDAAGIGPNDLMLGLSQLRERTAEAAFPFLSANTAASEDGSLVAAPFVLREIDGHRIAIAGLTGGQAGEAITVKDPLTSARNLLLELTAQADIIILLSQAGPEIDQQIADLLPGYDLIIGGGGPALTEPLPGASGALLLRADQSSAYHAGRAVGIGEFTFETDGTIVRYSWQRRLLNPEIADDPEMAAWAAGQ